MVSARHRRRSLLLLDEMIDPKTGKPVFVN